MAYQTDLAFAHWLATTENARQKEVALARDYFDGDLLVKISERVYRAMGYDNPAAVKSRLNIVRMVIIAVTERMSCFGFSSDSAELSQWATQLWISNLMQARQDQVHNSAINDGEAFAIVEWDGVADRPRIMPHPRFVDTGIGGDGFGCKAFYQSDDINQPMLRASKRWREVDAKGKAHQRLNEYYPNRIEKLIDLGQGFVRHTDPGDATWPVWWTDNASEDGEPLGIPVIHFTEPDLRPHAKDAWGSQDDLVNAVFDMVGNNRFSAFRIYKAFGWKPTIDGKDMASDRSNSFVIEPGMIIGHPGPADKSVFEAIEGTGSQQFIEAMREILFHIALVTGTPSNRFSAVTSGQVAAEGTLKQQQEQLFAKIRKRQIIFGERWKAAIEMAARLQRAFGVPVPEGEVAAQWETAETRSIAELAQEAKAKKESGVPDEQIWAEVWGYSQDEIAAMKAMDSYKAKAALMQPLTVPNAA